MKIFADILTFELPAYPFSGFVINFNVTTEGHRDRKDLDSCAVMVIGDHEGGELVFYEPGLVFPLREADWIVFQSRRITHFNLFFRGFRASLVLHSDGAGKQYLTEKKGWEQSSYCAR